MLLSTATYICIYYLFAGNQEKKILLQHLLSSISQGLKPAACCCHDAIHLQQPQHCSIDCCCTWSANTN